MKNGLYTATEIREATIAAAKDMVRHNLANDINWLARGLVALLARQTADEVSAQATKHDNDVGFNGLDGPILTSFAIQTQKWLATPPNERRYNSPLSPKQLPIARRKLDKYAGQLVRIAKATASPAA